MSHTINDQQRKKKNKPNSDLKKEDSSHVDNVRAGSERTLLPIWEYRQQIADSVRKYKTTIIVGETGSGKSTQLPQFLADLLFTGDERCIVCTQPRRVAAITIAEKVASERNAVLGTEVGYSIRFEDRTSTSTRIKYVTDGVLMRECMGDNNLEKYSVVILDEAHERSLQTDILMGLLLQLQQRRPDFRVVVMSATLQIDLFSGYFKDPNVVIIPGRQYPVDKFYVPEPETDFVDAAMIACLQVHEEEEEGGVLVFLPGQDDIESLQSLLEDRLGTVIPRHATMAARGGMSSSAALRDYSIHPLYAALSPEEQLKAFERSQSGIRKFVLSTNIAETSVTISGIKYVIDSGFVKMRMINPTTGIEMLKVVPISKSQGNQRAGRAGRESAGKCFRLFTEAAFEALETSTAPEIQRVDISQVLLQLKVIGVERPANFPFLSPPSETALRNALMLLFALNAFQKCDGSITEHGRDMSSLPLVPLFAHLLLSSKEYNCVKEMLTAVSVLSSESLFLQPHREEDKQAAVQAHRSFASKDGDLTTLLNVFEAWLKTNRDKRWATRHFLANRSLQHAFAVREQLTTILERLKIDPATSCYPEREPFLRCLLSGLPLNVAQRVSTSSAVMSSKSNQNVETRQINGKRVTYTNDNMKNLSGSYSSGAGGGVLADNSNAPYRTIRGHQGVHIHPSSVLFSMFNSRKLPEFVVFAELLTTSKQYMRNVSVIDGPWLTELFPSMFKSSSQPPVPAIPGPRANDYRK